MRSIKNRITHVYPAHPSSSVQIAESQYFEQQRIISLECKIEHLSVVLEDQISSASVIHDCLTNLHVFLRCQLCWSVADVYIKCELHDGQRLLEAHIAK
jgi:hypothetical protein